MSRVSETLGALGTLARRFLRQPSVEAEAKSEEEFDDIHTTRVPYKDSHITSSSNRVNVSVPMFKIPPEDDPELGTALYTLSRNVLGTVI